jgi:hypothetical protein
MSRSIRGWLAVRSLGMKESGKARQKAAEAVKRAEELDICEQLRNEGDREG